MKMEALKVLGGKAGTLAVKTSMKLRKYSPEIMLAGGLIAGTAAIVTACIATKKAEPVVEEARRELADIQNAIVINEDGQEESLTPKEIKKETFVVCKRLTWNLCKVYGLAAFLFLISVGLILGSHGVLKQRYISTTLAYKALDEAYKDYRERVKEAVGEEKERHFFHGTEEKGEKTIIDEAGEATTIKEAVKVHDKKYSPYEFDFNAQTCPGNWEAHSDYNFTFLRNAENYFNDLLNSRGHVFLNEILDYLGFKRTPEGAVTGWVKGNGGDDYVDFGVFDYYTDEYCDQNDGYIKNIHLNFNVDGVIWDKI